MTIVFRLHDKQWQVLLGGSVVMLAKTPEQGAASAARLHLVLLRDRLVDEGHSIELGPGATEEHLRYGYAAVGRDDLFERRAVSGRRDRDGLDAT